MYIETIPSFEYLHERKEPRHLTVVKATPTAATPAYIPHTYHAVAASLALSGGWVTRTFGKLLKH
jgi:hypothetical protein